MLIANANPEARGMARRLRPSTRPYLCEYQQLAWLAWRSDAAVLEFSGTRAQSERLWKRARHGTFPPGLGKPMVAPALAEDDLDHVMTARRRPPVWKERP